MLVFIGDAWAIQREGATRPAWGCPDIRWCGVLRLLPRKRPAPVEVCRNTGISQATFYAWKEKHGGRMPPEMKRLRQLEEENARLKRIVANLSLDKEMLQDVLKRKL